MNNTRLNPTKILLYGLVVIFMTQIGAIVDLFEHSEIPYFHREHIVVGALAGGFTLLVGLIIYRFTNRLEKNDLEREKLLEELIIAKEKAEESDRLKSAFLANMSHEIRTPMNGILGFTELLENPEFDGADKQGFIDIIKSCGTRLLHVINDIIDISRIESGQMPIIIAQVNINDLLKEIYSVFKPEAENKGLLFTLNENPSGEMVVIETDHNKLFDIMSKLVKNAIKYTEKGTIEFGFIKKDKILDFFVKDTGIGIPIERQKDIFKRFIQADIADKRALQGSGLGLAIANSYVEMLKGEISVESHPDLGSEFRFSIPYKAILQNTPKPQARFGNIKNKSKTNNLKILIVEDDNSSEMLFKKILENANHKIFYTINGVDAVETCKQNTDIDLILMDIKMPEMNGFSATQEIRKFNKDVIIIAQTAFGLVGDEQKAIASGCDDYITKPINRKKLHSLIYKYFGNEIALPLN